MDSPALEAALARAVGDGHLLTDPELRAPYERDWTGRFGGPARAVVRPETTDEVAAVVEACATAGVAIVTRGGNTGLVGGSVPRPAPASVAARDGAGGGGGGGAPVVVSLERLRELGTIDRATLQVSAGAGVTLAELQDAAAARPEAGARSATEARLAAGLDLGARDGATLGGLVACDAGGPRALRYGTARARVAGLEAVLADGSVIRRMSGLLKDNAGYDLPSLLIGSEGTLGLITAVRWRLVVDPQARAAALVGLDSLGEAAELLAGVRGALPSLESCEFLDRASLELAREHLRVSSPLAGEHGAYLLLECAADTEPVEELAAALGDLKEERVAVATGSADRDRLWGLRDAVPEAIGTAGVPHKLDVGVPPARLAEFETGVRERLTALAPNARAFLFGHLADGNVHVNLLGLEPDDERPDRDILELAAACGGTISAEHGVGSAKAAHLALARSEAEIAAMRRIKHALDPQCILNPGVALP